MASDNGKSFLDKFAGGSAKVGNQGSPAFPA